MTSRPAGEPGPADADAASEVADSQWVDSFLRTRLGKTYRLDAGVDAPEDASREALAASAKTLIDRVLRESRSEPPS